MGGGGSRAALSYLAYRGLGEAIQRVPEPLAAAGGAVVVEAMARRRSTSRAMGERHMRRVLASSSPVVAPDEALVRRWARRSFRSYGRYWVEGGLIPAVEPEDILRRITVESGWEHLERGMAAGRGVVMALPHVGSWEWGGAMLALRGFPMTAVAERIEPPRLFEWFIEQRHAMGIDVVPLDTGSATSTLRTLREGRLVGLICDRDIVGNGVAVEFLGETTTLPPGPATLALRTGAALVTAAVFSGPGRHHRAVVSPPIDTARTGSFRSDVRRITQEVARHFEGYIRRAPEQWHLFQPNWPSDDDDGPGGDGHGDHPPED